MVGMEGAYTQGGENLSTNICIIYKDSEVKEDTARWGLEENPF